MSNLQVGKFESWENSLARAITSNSQEHINFQRVGESIRVVFMPHSPGIYIALVLKSHDEIEQECALKTKDLNLTDTNSVKSESAHAVRKLNIKNNLFLDIESLSKNMQKILT